MILRDEFERSNRDLPGLTPDGWSWVADAGTGASAWGISNGRLARRGDSKTAPISASKRLETEDQRFRFQGVEKMQPGSATLWFGIVLRFVDASNFHLIRYTPPTGSTGAQILIQQAGGPAGNTVTANIATPADPWEWAGSVKRVDANTVRTSVTVNGVEVASHTTLAAAAWPSTATADRGTVKLTGYANSARLNDESRAGFFGDFLAQDVAQPSRYATTRWNGTTEQPVKPDGAFLEYIVGETDPDWPQGLTEYPPAYTSTW